MILRLILFCTIVAVLKDVKSQITFTKEIGGYSTQRGYAVKQCYDNGYIITGWGSGNSTYIARTNEYGDTLWTRDFRSFSCGFDVIQLKDSTFLLSGYSSGGSFGNLTRFDNNGDTIPWINQSPIYGWGQALQQTYDGGAIIAGERITKVKPSGQLQYVKTSQAMYIIQNNDSSYTYINYGSNGISLTRIDENGNIVFDKDYLGCTLINTSNNCLAGTNDGGFVVTGQTLSGAGILIKTNATGDSLWSRVLPIEYGTAVVQTPDNGYAVAGASNGQMALVKMDSTGLLKWVQYYGEDGDELAKSLQGTKDGGFILTGSTKKVGSTTSDVLLIKTDKNGQVFSTGNTEPSSELLVLNTFPNPSTGKFYLNLNRLHPNFTLTINDITGRLISTAEYSITDQIELEIQKPGVYVINVFGPDGLKATTKVIRL